MLFWIPFTLWLIPFLIGFLMFLLLDEEKITFAQAMEILFFLIVWPAVVLVNVVNSRIKKVPAE